MIALGSSLVGRYSSAFSIAILLWDYLITIEENLKAVRRSKNTEERTLEFWLSKISFVANRYLVEAAIIYIVYVLSSGRNADKVLAIYLWLVLVIGTLVSAISRLPLLVKLEVVVWNVREGTRYMMLATFITIIVVLVSAATICLSASSLDNKDEIPKPFIIATATLVFYDCYILIVNKYHENMFGPQQSVKSSKTKTYALIGVMAILAIRITILLLSLILKKGELSFSIAMIVMAISSVINSRLELLEVSKLYPQSEEMDWDTSFAHLDDASKTTLSTTSSSHEYNIGIMITVSTDVKVI
ncbi:hypothetical protein BDQ17DRAFT_1351483 [Cyathus striatus]|nr:hypothetical protein BDQ17DRAFT_1351483 [Cyathus striatus]